jgi:hypothetical protein
MGIYCFLIIRTKLVLKVDIPNFGLVSIPQELIEKYRILNGTKTPFTGFDILARKERTPETQPVDQGRPEASGISIEDYVTPSKR